MIQTSFFPGDEPEKPIPIDPTGLQPIKMEDVLPDQDIQLDTYMFYPNGGYHFFTELLTHYLDTNYLFGLL